MPDELPNDKPQTPTTATATVENRDASGTLLSRQRLKMETEFGNTPGGVMANIWAKLGLIAAVVIFFGGSMLWMMSAVNSQVDLLREELKEARLAAAAERKEMYDRYISGREINEKRHQEVLAKIEKATLFMDHMMKWYFTERHGKGTFSTPPKMEDIK